MLNHISGFSFIIYTTYYLSLIYLYLCAHEGFGYYVGTVEEYRADAY
jgi:hypothetical protein